MIRGHGFEVEYRDGVNEARWIPVEFFATTLAPSRDGSVGIALLVYACAPGQHDGPDVLVLFTNPKVRKSGFVYSYPHSR
jgi:hypothetical protein